MRIDYQCTQAATDQDDRESGPISNINDNITPCTKAHFPGDKAPYSPDFRQPALTATNPESAHSMATDDLESMMRTRYFKMYQVDLAIGRLANTARDLTQILEQIAINRKGEADLINHAVSNMEATKKSTQEAMKAASNSVRLLGFRALNTAALTGTAIGATLISGTLGGQQDKPNNATQINLTRGAYLLGTLLCYRLLRSPEAAQLSHSTRLILKNMWAISNTGCNLLGHVTRSGAQILEDVGKLTEQAAVTSDVAQQTLQAIRGA
jgi:hypothetical protein